MSIKYDRPKFAPYLRVLADLLALRDWTFVVSDDQPANHNAMASTVIWYGRRRATIRLSEEFLKESEENQRHTSAHELIHCHLDTLERLATREAESGDLIRPIRLALELAVDGLADAIAPFLPLPGAILDKGREAMATKTPATTRVRGGSSAAGKKAATKTAAKTGASTAKMPAGGRSSGGGSGTATAKKKGGTKKGC